MATPTLPNPQLAEAARVAQRALDRFEHDLRSMTFRGTVLDIVAVADGRGEITSLVVPAARIPSSNAPDRSLDDWIRQALDKALSDLRRDTNHALDRARPSLPGTGGQDPGSIAHNVGRLLHAPWTGTSAQGQIAVTVALDWRVAAVTIAGSFYVSADRLLLGQRVREAANAALSTSRREVECAAAGLAKFLLPPVAP